MTTESQKKLAIDIGCGRYKTPGTLGVDIVQRDSVDIVHDLGIFPYPFKESSVDEIYCNHVLEHVDDFIKTVHELYRISKNGAKIFVRVPHASCVGTAWADPTHKRFFVKNSFIHFSGENSGIYGFQTNIKIKNVELHFLLYQGNRLGERLTKTPIWLGNLIDSIVNLHPLCQDLFERFFIFWVGGVEEVYFELEVIK